MSLWLVRAGGSGEYESKFLSEGRIYITKDDLRDDLSKLESKKDSSQEGASDKKETSEKPLKAEKRDQAGQKKEVM